MKEKVCLIAMWHVCSLIDVGYCAAEGGRWRGRRKLYCNLLTVTVTPPRQIYIIRHPMLFLLLSVDAGLMG